MRHNRNTTRAGEKASDERPARWRPRIFWGLLALPFVVLAMSAVGEWQASPASAVYERASATAPFRLIEGSRGSKPFGLNVFSLTSNISHTATSSNRPDAESPRQYAHPFTDASISIVDLSGTELNRFVADAVAKQMLKHDSMRRVDLRLAGEPLETSRLGELILIIEEIEVERSGLGHWETHHRAKLGYVPQYGWTDVTDVVGPIVTSWSIQGQFDYLGLPLSGKRNIAQDIADVIDLPAKLSETAEALDPVAPAPAGLLVEAYDGPSGTRVAEVTGLTEPPLLRGFRAAMAGESIWRYEGADVVARLKAAVEAFEADGWEKGKGWTRGVNGDLHRAYLRRGQERVEWTYEENRTTLLQTTTYVSARLPNGTWSKSEKRVEGDELLPVLWVHYWNEMSPDDLRSGWEEAQAAGEHAQNTFKAYLSAQQQESLGIQDESAKRE